MSVNEANQALVKQTTGMVAMQTATGIQALYHSFALEQPQLMVMEGVLTKMRQKLLSMPDNVSNASSSVKTSHANKANQVIDTDSLVNKVQQALLQTVSQLMKIKIADFDVNDELSEYGLDSIELTNFSNQLNFQYDLDAEGSPLSPTIFFEYPTIASLAKYLSEEYQAVFVKKLAVPTKLEVPIETPVENEKENSNRDRSVFKPRTRRTRFATHPVEPVAEPQPSAASADDAIAIIGMSGRFPMANDLNEFWNNLKEGKDCITEIPADRWDWQAIYGDPKKEPNKTNIKWGSFIDGIDEFDPLFFNISPREAELMDPQQRLLMLYVWKAIEDAGYSPESLSGSKTGLFVGTADCGYPSLITNANVAMEGYTSTGLVPSMGPNRMSYFLNIHGPQRAD
jgi:polyketide synthase PksN